MRRREFITGLGSAAAWPVVVRAQQGDRVRRIGVLMSGENGPEGKRRYAAFTQALADLGWIDGGNVRMDLRWGGGDNKRPLCPYPQQARFTGKVSVIGGVPVATNADLADPTKYQCIAAKPWDLDELHDREERRDRE